MSAGLDPEAIFEQHLDLHFDFPHIRWEDLIEAIDAASPTDVEAATEWGSVIERWLERCCVSIAG